MQFIARRALAVILLVFASTAIGWAQYASITRVMRLPQVAEKLAREAMEPEISASPEEFAAFVRRDHASYEPIVRASGAKAD